MSDEQASTPDQHPGDPATDAMPGGMSIGDTLLQLVPFTRTLGLEFGETTMDRSVVRLPARPETSNHLGGPHAGAIFTAAESASGAVTLAAFGAPRPEATPVVARASMEFVKFAATDVVAIGRLVGDRQEALDRLAAGERPEFDVEVECFSGDRLVTRATITWTLIRQR